MGTWGIKPWGRVYIQGSKIGKSDSLGRVEIIVGLACLRTNKPDGAGLLFLQVLMFISIIYVRNIYSEYILSLFFHFPWRDDDQFYLNKITLNFKLTLK